MKRAILSGVILLAGLSACSRGGGNDSNSANIIVEEGDLDSAIGGDELSPNPEAEDDMIANSSGVGNGTGSGNSAGGANASAPPQPPVQPPPIPGPPPPSR